MAVWFGGVAFVRSFQNLDTGIHSWIIWSWPMAGFAACFIGMVHAVLTRRTTQLLAFATGAIVLVGLLVLADSIGGITLR